MPTLAQCLPALPGFAGPKTYAAWPVWSDSTTKEIRFQPMPKKAATRLWHRARDFDRQTTAQGRHGGAVGHAALQVLHALIFDFLNYRERPARPVLCGDRAQGECVRAHGRQRAQAAARAWHPQLGAPLRRELAGRPLRAGAGDERLCRAAGDAVARLQAAAGAAGASSRAHGATTLPCPPCWRRRSPSGATAATLRSVIGILESDPGGRARRGARAARPGGAGAQIRSDLPDCTQCGETLPQLNFPLIT